MDLEHYIPEGASKRSISLFKTGTERYRKQHQKDIKPEILFYNSFNRKARLRFACGHEVILYRPERYSKSMLEICPECYRIDNSLKDIESALKLRQAKLANTDPIKKIKSEKMLSHWNEKMYRESHEIQENSIINWVQSLKDWIYLDRFYKNRNWMVRLKHSCGECVDSYYLREPRCPRCNPFSSNEELNVLRFVQQYYPDARKSRHNEFGNNYELDIFIPSLNIAFEYNGFYWHSSNFHGSGYHHNKVMSFKDLGIKVYSLWSYWPSDCVKSIIKSKLGVTTKIYARKCTVCVPLKEEVIEFCSRNHIAGYVKYDYVCALKYDDEIVSMMLITNRNGVSELSRFVTKTHLTVVGGFSKLLKNLAFKGTLVSYAYCDLNPDYKDTVYYKNGFIYERTNKYSMKYYDIVNHEVIQRRNLQKDKIKDRYPDIYCNSKSEKEMLRSIGIYQIYDTGTHKFRIDL